MPRVVGRKEDCNTIEGCKGDCSIYDNRIECLFLLLSAWIHVHIRLAQVLRMRTWRVTRCSSSSMCLMEGRRRTIAMVTGNSRTSGLNQSRCGRLKLLISPSHLSTLPPLEKYVHIFTCLHANGRWSPGTLYMCACEWCTNTLTMYPLHMIHICCIKMQFCYANGSLCILCRWMQRRGFPFVFPDSWGFVRIRSLRMLQRALKWATCSLGIQITKSSFCTRSASIGNICIAFLCCSGSWALP